MKKLFIILLFLVFAVEQGWCATYYVDGDAAAGGDGSISTPWNTITAAQSGSANNDTIYITGSFSGETLTGKTGQTWIKWGESPTILNTEGIVAKPVTDCTYEGLILDGGNGSNSVIYLITDTTGWIYNKCIIRGGSRTFVMSAGSGKVSNSIIYGGTHENPNYMVGGTLIFSGNVVSGGRYPINTAQVGFKINNGDIRLYGNAFLGIFGDVIHYKRNTVTRIDIQNNVLVGYGTERGSDSYAIYGMNTPGTIVENISNNYLTAMGKSPLKAPIKGVTASSSYTGDIGLTGLAESRFMIAIDDYNPWDNSFYSDLSDLAVSNKVPITHFINGTSTISTDNWAFLNSLVKKGYYKLGHHCTHSTLLVSSLYPYLFYFSTYPANATVAFNGTEIEITSDGSNIVYSKDIAGMSYSRLASELNALSGFNIVAHTSTPPNMKCKVMATVSKTTISNLSSGQMVIDYGAVSSRYYDYMITESKTRLETEIPAEYIVNAIAYPGGYFDATLIAWLKANTTYAIGWGINTRTNHTDLRLGVNPYKLFRVSHTDIVGSDDSDTQQNIRSTALMLSTQGNSCGFFAHNATEFSIHNFELLMSTMKANGVSLVDSDSIYSFISSHTLNGDEWHREGAVTISGKIGEQSVAINKGTWITGVNMEGQTDPWGKGVYKIPNIGADQGAGAPKGGGGDNLYLGKEGIFLTKLRRPIPTLPFGYDSVVDKLGNYIVDESGNYVIVPNGS